MSGEPLRASVPSAADDPLLAPLRRISVPPLSAAGRERVRARLLDQVSKAPGAHLRWRGIALATAGLGAALLVGAGLVGSLAERSPSREFRAAPCAALALPARDSAQLVLLGDSTAHQRGNRVLELAAGTLLVRTAARPVQVRAPDDEAIVEPHSTAEVRVESRRMVVAAYVGEAAGRWAGATSWTTVRAGQEVSAAGPRPQRPHDLALVSALLAGERRDLCAPPQPAELSAPPHVAPPHATTAVQPPPALAPAPPQLHHRPLIRTSSTPPATKPEVAEPLLVPPAADESIVREAALLGGAIERLHQRHDSGGTLALLEQYRREFPRGRLADEARAVHIDALIAAEQRGEALRLLDAFSLGETPRAAELHVLRGELRLAAGRRAEACTDFTTARGLSSGMLKTRAQSGLDSARCASAN